MNAKLIASLVAVSAVLVAETALAGGACYRRVTTPPVYGTVAEQVVLQPARTIAYEIPAEYGQVTERVMTQPARQVVRRVPAVTQLVSEQVMVRPGGKVWQVTRDAFGRDIGCWVHTPPVYATQTRTIVVRPEAVAVETIPAVYETVTRPVLVRAASVRREVVPAVTGVRHRQVMVSPGSDGWRPLDPHCR